MSDEPQKYVTPGIKSGFSYNVLTDKGANVLYKADCSKHSTASFFSDKKTHTESSPIPTSSGRDQLNRTESSDTPNGLNKCSHCNSKSTFVCTLSQPHNMNIKEKRNTPFIYFCINQTPSLFCIKLLTISFIFFSVNGYLRINNIEINVAHAGNKLIISIIPCKELSV